jgi:hypothetical protein
LKTLHVRKAIVDPRAWEDGDPMILLRWGNAEETCTGDQDDAYEGRIRATFADENLSSVSS